MSSSNAKQGLRASESRFLSFSLGSEEFAIPLLAVKEVIAVPDLTPMPRSPAHFLGIMNLRGLVIPVIDLGAKLEIKNTKTSTETAVIICDLEPYHLGIKVDSINSVVTPAPGDISVNPEAPGSRRRDFISSVYRREKTMVLLLNIGKVLDSLDQQSLEQTTTLEKAS